MYNHEETETVGEKERDQGPLGKFAGHMKEYLEVRMDLVALNFQDRMAEITASFTFAVVVGVLTAVMLLFLSMAGAFLLGRMMENTALGFFLVAAFYALLGILAALFKNQWIKSPIINFLMRKININETD